MSKMKQRSSNNWLSRAGTWDALNTQLIDFDIDYPVLSSIPNLLPFDITICNDYQRVKENSLISTFVDDYILERYWNNPLKYVSYYKKAMYVMSPDFSLFIGMPKPMQMWNVYRNRLVGYVWQSAGINVIPTISWSDKNSFEYCFEGVEIGSVVAVSNIGCRNEEHKIYFDDGFYKMIEILKPSQIIFQCNKKYKGEYNKNNIIFIESFWDLKRKNKNI